MKHNKVIKPLLLVVDDDPETLVMIDELLRDEYRIKVATSGSNAIDIAKDEDIPDLILLDIMMPDLSGFDTCCLLKADPATKSIPIIFLTASTDNDSEVKGLEIGAADFISKPIRPAILKLRIHNILRMKQLQKRIASYALMQKNKVEELSVKADSGLSLKEHVAFLEEQLKTYKDSYDRFVGRHKK